MRLSIQGGLGLPEKDYYLRTGAKDETMRKQYVDARGEDAGAGGNSAGAGGRRMPKASWRSRRRWRRLRWAWPTCAIRRRSITCRPIATFEQTMPGVDFGAFQKAIHSPEVSEMNNANAGVLAGDDEGDCSGTDIETLKAYMRYHVLTTAAASRLPKTLR